VAVTGIAGPEGDGSSVQVGTVWIATARIGSDSRAVLRHYHGDRNEVRKAAARDAIADAAQRLTKDIQEGAVGLSGQALQESGDRLS
jgi:nicotinamide-nucleotide amidase